VFGKVGVGWTFLTSVLTALRGLRVREVNKDGIAKYSVSEYLRDRQPVTIRAIRPSDKGLIIEALRGLSTDSLYRRLFATKKEFTDADLKQMTEVDFLNVVALVAVLERNGNERIAGEGRYIRSGEAGTIQKAEVAFLIDDAFQGLGIASHLLKHLIAIARESGITHFEAEVLRTNQAMLAILARSGFPVERSVTRDFIYAVMDLRTEGQSPAPASEPPGGHGEKKIAQGTAPVTGKTGSGRPGAG
jgi:RimJ/RimL family protein N-acetyltransferase